MYNNWTDDAILSELGSRLRQQRLNQNVSQTDLAEKAGVSWGTLRNAEAGKGSSVTTLIRLLRALGVLQRLEADHEPPIHREYEQTADQTEYEHVSERTRQVKPESRHVDRGGDPDAHIGGPDAEMESGREGRNRKGDKVLGDEQATNAGDFTCVQRSDHHDRIGAGASFRQKRVPNGVLATCPGAGVA